MPRNPVPFISSHLVPEQHVQGTGIPSRKVPATITRTTVHLAPLPASRRCQCCSVSSSSAHAEAQSAGSVDPLRDRLPGLDRRRSGQRCQRCAVCVVLSAGDGSGQLNVETGPCANQRGAGRCSTLTPSRATTLLLRSRTWTCPPAGGGAGRVVRAHEDRVPASTAPGALPVGAHDLQPAGRPGGGRDTLFIFTWPSSPVLPTATGN